MGLGRISFRRGVVLGLALCVAVGGSVAGAKHYDDGGDSAVAARTAEPVPAATEARAQRPSVSRATRQFDPSMIAIPVLGVTASQLRDTYDAPRGAGRIHHAMDILIERGTPVVAAVDGVILKLYQSGPGGITIYLADHEGDILYYYAHLDRYERGLAEGDLVDRGQVIGYVGTTGNAPADAPHLHFSIEHLPETGEWWKGQPINPFPILVSRGYTVE